MTSKQIIAASDRDSPNDAANKNQPHHASGSGIARAPDEHELRGPKLYPPSLSAHLRRPRGELENRFTPGGENYFWTMDRPANEGTAPDFNGALRGDVGGIRYSELNAGAPPSTPEAGATGWLAAVAHFVQGSWKALQREREIARMTERLAELDDRCLRDIGLHRWQIEDAVRYGRR